MPSSLTRTFYGGAILLGPVFGLAAQVVAVRALSEPDAASVVAASAFAGLLFTTLSFGYERYVLVTVPRAAQARAAARQFVTHRRVLAVRLALASIASMGWALWSKPHGGVLVGLIALATFVLVGAIGLLNELLVALEKFGTASIVTYARRAAPLLPFVTPAMLVSDPLRWIATVLCVAAVVGLVGSYGLAARAAREADGRGGADDPDHPRDHGQQSHRGAATIAEWSIRQSLRYGLLPAVTSAYLYVDVLMLQHFSSAAELLVYRTSYLFAATATLGYLVAQRLSAAALVRASADRSALVEANIAFSRRAVGLVTLGLCAACLLGPTLFARLVPDIEWRPQLYCGLIVTFAVHYAPPYGEYLLVTDRPVDAARLAAVAAVVNLIANIALIPPYGATGAGTAFLASVLTLRVLYTWAAFRHGMLPSRLIRESGAAATAVAIAAGLVLSGLVRAF